MTATIHRLHNTNPVAGYLRVSHHDHRWLDDQLARGTLPFRRFVFEAAHIRQQRQLVGHLRAANCEIVLDSNFAELSSIAKFQGASRQLPWARPDKPWSAEDLVGNRADYVASQSTRGTGRRCPQPKRPYRGGIGLVRGGRPLESGARENFGTFWWKSGRGGLSANWHHGLAARAKLSLGHQSSS